MSVKAVEDYVKEVSRLAKSGITTEHTFRGALAVLLDQLAAGLKAFNEPKRTDCGAPDYIVQDKTGLGVFYVEAKDLGDGDLDGKKRTGHKEQFDRYKAALDTIIFTDYLDFRLYRHGQLVSSVKIADWDGAGKVSGIAVAYDALAELIAEASSAKPQKIESSKRLAELMAGKARLLQRNAAKFLSPLTTAYDAAPAGAKPPVAPLLPYLTLRDASAEASWQSNAEIRAMASRSWDARNTIVFRSSGTDPCADPVAVSHTTCFYPHRFGKIFTS